MMKEHENELSPETGNTPGEIWPDEISSQDRYLVQRLRTLSWEYVQENEQALDRIWSRLAQSQKHSVSLPLRRRAHENTLFPLKEKNVIKEKNVMQENNEVWGTTSSIDPTPAKGRRSPWKKLGVGFLSAAALLLIVVLAVFTLVPRTATTGGVGHPGQQQPAQQKPNNLICSFSNENNASSMQGWRPTLDWSSQGQIVTTFLNLKTFSGTNCQPILDSSNQDFAGTWSPDGMKLVTLTSNNTSLYDSNGNAYQLVRGGTLTILDRN
ncbi:MAG TPA: hypothetical protein VFN35_15815, partial [Ktedonobacteraceae bacterium]|nr:hypothetical protein [Ktedonobacteraceae bacterium]